MNACEYSLIESQTMAAFNRIIVILLWLALLVASIFVALDPIGAMQMMADRYTQWANELSAWRVTSPTNYIIAQIAFGIGAVVLCVLLLWMQVSTLRKRGVRIYTADGGAAELDTDSVGRRLSWHLDQVAEIVTAVPNVKSRGSAVDIKLEIEAAPDVDIPMKTEEVVQVTREVIENDLGLRMGKLDVHMRCAPFQPDWA
jgi:hypothetical protein